MTQRASFAMGWLLSSSLLGCSAGEDSRTASETSAVEDSAFRAPASQSGRLALAAGGLRFITCGEIGGGVPVEDLPSGEGRALLQEFGGETVTALVRLEGSRLLEIRYAAPEGFPCDLLPPEGDIEARGNEPFWHVRVAGETAVVRTPEEQDGVQYEDGAWSRLGEKHWLYQAARTRDGASEPISLEVTEERCTDGMSGARYPYRAVLVRSGMRMEGCALEGSWAQARAKAP